MPKDFFSTIRERLARKPSRDFDRQFWAKFDAEFGPRGFSWRALLRPRVLVPVGAAAILALTAVVPRLKSTKSAPLAEIDFVSSETQLVLQDLDLFLSPGEDLTALDDADWDYLLKGEDG